MSRINIEESFLIEDGENVHVFVDEEYKGVLDIDLYEDVLKGVEKTIRLPTDPQLNILLHDSGEELGEELPQEIKWYDENIQKLRYRHEGELEELFRNSSSEGKENPPLANLAVKGAAALTGLVLSEGIKNKMKNKGMLPRAVSRSQPREISATTESDYSEKDYEFEREEKKEIDYLESDAKDNPDDDDIDTKVSDHPPAPTPGDDEEEDESDVAGDVPEGIEDVVEDEPVEPMEIEEVPVPNLTHIETSDEGVIASGLYPLPFDIQELDKDSLKEVDGVGDSYAESILEEYSTTDDLAEDDISMISDMTTVPRSIIEDVHDYFDIQGVHADKFADIRQSFLSDVWKYTSWDKDDIDGNRPDDGYLKRLFKEGNLKYLLLVNLARGEVVWSEFASRYKDIDEDEWIAKFKDFLGYDEDDYILLGYTSDTLSGDIYKVGGKYYPPDSPTHVLVEDRDDREEVFSWKIVPIQQAEDLHLFDERVRRDRKLFERVKSLYNESSADFAEQVPDVFEAVAVVGSGTDAYVSLYGDVDEPETWYNWKESLMSRVGINTDMSDDPCIMFRVDASLSDELPKTDEQARERVFEDFRVNPPIRVTDRIPTEVDEAKSLMDDLDKVEDLPRENIEYQPKSDDVPLVPKQSITDEPIFHNPESPVWVSKESSGDEPGTDERVEKGKQDKGASVVKENPRGIDDELMQSIKKEVGIADMKGFPEEGKIPIYQRPFEPSKRPDAHFEKLASIDNVFENIFAFPDELTRAMVMCSTLNGDWVTLLKGIPGSGKTVLAHLIMMAFMNDVDFQTDEVNANSLYGESEIANYLQSVDVWGVTKHNQDKQPDDVFYETEIRMTESVAPEEALMAKGDRFKELRENLEKLQNVGEWRRKLRAEGYSKEAIRKIDLLIERLDIWSDLDEKYHTDIRAAHKWVDMKFERGADDAPPIDDIIEGKEVEGDVDTVDGLRENIPKDIERQLEAVRGKTRLGTVRDYVFDPKRKPIVESLIKYHNEANRANPNVADTMLGLIAEKQVEYLGKPLSSPIHGQDFPCLHYLDYNPHLDMREDQELDRALLDRANMGIYMRQADFRGRHKILHAKYGLDWDSDGDASSKTVEEQLLERAKLGLEAKNGFEPLSYLELQEIWNVVDQIPLTDQQLMLVNIITQHFSMLYRVYDTEAHDIKDVAEDLIDKDLAEVVQKKRSRFFNEREPELVANSDTKELMPNFVDTSTITYVNAKQTAGKEVGSGVGGGKFHKTALMNNIDRELGLRSAEALIKLIKAYAYYKAAKKQVAGEIEINDMSDFQKVIKDEWIPLLLTYVVEHRINIGVKKLIKSNYYNFGDFVDGWYLPRVLVEAEGENEPPLWTRWKIWTKCAHPDISNNQNKLIENILEVIEQKKANLPDDSELLKKFEAYDTREALMRDVDGSDAEPTIQAIFNSVGTSD